MSDQLDLARIASLDGPVVFIGFHPDDLDFHTGGLAALLVSSGANVMYVVVTSGEGGGSANIREDEQRLSATATGVSQVKFLRYGDGRLGRAYHSGHLQSRFASLIRELKPSMVVSFCPGNLITLSWGAEHPDHRYGALALWDAIYPEAHAAGHRPWWQFWREPLPGHKVTEVLWFGDDLESPYSANCFVPIDSVWIEMQDALRAHRSQWDESFVIPKAEARARRAAQRWNHAGLAEEYRHIRLV